MASKYLLAGNKFEREDELMGLNFKGQFNYFNNKRQNRMINNLLSVSGKKKIVERITTLQNEISVAHDTKVIAISSFGDDRLAASFAKAMADVYALNGSGTFIIDANLYNPCLHALIGVEPSSEVQKIDMGNGFVHLSKEIYPSIVFKNGSIQKLISSGLEDYDHVILLVPSVLEYKEISLLSREIDSAILVSRQNVTKKRHIFDALQFCLETGISVSKVIVLK